MNKTRDHRTPQSRRYRWPHALLLVGAIVFGVAGMMAARGYIAAQLEDERARLADRGRTTGVLVARAGLAPGQTVDTDTVAVRQVPVHLVDGSMIADAEFDAVRGSRLALPMTDGEPIRRAALLMADDGFSSRVGHGIRALTIEVDEVNSLSGMLRPGDRIDLLFTTQSSPEQPGVLSAPLMQDLRILATGARVGGIAGALSEREGFRAITVEVTPVQAQKLVLAQRSGRLTALLRNPDDRQPMAQEAIDIRALLGLPPRTHPVVSTGPEIIVGGQGPIRPVALPAASLKP